MKLNPFGSRLIVKREADDKIGVIVVPESVKKASLIGTVIAIGPECTLTEVGSKILFARFGFFDLPLGDEYKECLIMNQEDILAEVEDNTQTMEVVSNA